MLVVLVIHPQVGVALKRDIMREMSEVINFLILKFQDLKGSNLFTPPVGHQVNGTRVGAREGGDLISGERSDTNPRPKARHLILLLFIVFQIHSYLRISMLK